jgi:hypothetical protein
MTMKGRPPDLSDLIGDEGSPQERKRLQRVHELLLSAGPPPELPQRLTRPPHGRRLMARLGRRRAAALALAAALAAAAFALGYAVSPGGSGFQAVRVVPMHGLGSLAEAQAELRIGVRDEYGNTPIEMVVRGLPPLPPGGYYELYLSKKGKPRASCGTFRTGPGPTKVRLSIAYRLQPWGRWWDGWVITAHVPDRPAAPERVLLTT